MFTEEQIKNISVEQFKNLSAENKQLVLKILDEYKTQGESKTLKEIWEVDYDEIPVSIDEFICNDRYLGKSTGNGTLIYPYWRQKYREIFDPSLDYEEIVLTGAIGVGKTRTAVICLCYLLYKLMCLKNPQRYYNLLEGDKITIFFLNITLDLAEGVGFETMHQYLIASPWFRERGTITGVKKIRYNPPHNIELSYGSKGEHALGQQVYCLASGTKILTTEGIFNIEELEKKIFKTYCISNSGEVVESYDTTVIKTTETNEFYEIELEDGSVIKCTPEHKLMLKDGSYKKVKDLTEEDELFDY